MILAFVVIWPPVGWPWFAWLRGLWSRLAHPTGVSYARHGGERMTRRLVLALIVAAVLMPGLLWAQRARNTEMVYGIGTESCGSWIKTRTEPARGEWLPAGAWVQGWISAADHYAVPGPLARTDGDAMAAWLDQYCNAHPLDRLDIAAGQLAVELSRRAAQQRVTGKSNERQ
jgi:hypothetical protein